MSERRQWKCSKCGDEAISKCPSQRSVFPDDERAAVLSNLLRIVPIEKSHESSPYDRVQVTFEMHLLPDENILNEVWHLLKDLTEQTLVRASCDHDWQIQFGRCLFGCHVAAGECDHGPNGSLDLITGDDGISHYECVYCGYTEDEEAPS